jgi:iron complex outermembrane receptor protein
MRLTIFVLFVLLCQQLCGQTIKGKVIDNATGDPVFSATIIEKGSTNGVSSDFDGTYKIDVSSLPTTLSFSFIGYVSKEVLVESASKRINVYLEPDNVEIGTAEVVGERISEKQKQAPLTVESMDVISIKEAPSGSFYEGLGNLKGVDLTSASLGFKIINTRGFNSTSPVRSLQLIDGVDNQSPGLNFSLGNFLGAPDLDIKKVDVIAGASSAFFGPGAFNGVINMETKNPFLFKGLDVQMRLGERGLTEHQFRFAESIQNKDEEEVFAYKVTFFSLQARDWEAENYEPVYGSLSDEDNPGRFDAVNVYGDEFFPANNFSTSTPWNFKGLGIFYRTGYKERDLVDYNTKNIKANVALHLRTNPSKDLESPELIWGTNVGNGTTVYQGDNRFSLRDIVFVQNRLEFRKTDKFFIRAYMTTEDAGNSYDPYATALRMLGDARSNEDWAKVYLRYWNDSIDDIIDDLGYPELEFIDGALVFDYDSLDVWLETYHDSLAFWHSQVENWTNNGNGNLPGVNELAYPQPGTDAFNTSFNGLVSSKNNDEESGTRFFDRSSLYHVHAEYIWEPTFLDQIITGVSGRLYRPDSDGTIFYDTAGTTITNSEWGAYVGVQHKVLEDKLILNGTWRIDKNQNYDLISSPAASLVWKPNPNHYLRATFSSALRNPTLADQYLYLNVGPAILSGNLEGVDSLITLSSFSNYRATLDTDTLEFFNIDPIRPEQVKTFELGYRGTVNKNMYVDLGYYYSIYNHFIGFSIGIDAEFGDNGLPTDLQAFRYSANSINEVRTQGFAIGLNYYLNEHFMLAGNYSWNKLVKGEEDDPIIPAFNTPEHKYNLSVTARELPSRWGRGNLWGFGVNYKWIEGFLFEGSPQFTGFVPSYNLTDVQVNYFVKPVSMTIKLGASNVFNNLQVQTYGGPVIGRLGYISFLYELK